MLLRSVLSMLCSSLIFGKPRSMGCRKKAPQVNMKALLITHYRHEHTFTINHLNYAVIVSELIPYKIGENSPM